MKNKLLREKILSSLNINSFKRMKLIVLFIALSVWQLSASESYAQNAKISLNLKNATLKEVIQSIEKQTEFVFFYSNEEIDTNKKVDINKRNSDIAEVLNTILSNYSYRIENRKILLMPKAIQQSSSKIKGVVKDAAGETIIGANVMVKGTSNGTITDMNGDFMLNASPNDILVVTYIGYQQQEIPLKGKTFVNIVMQEDAKALDEVVVVGYGTQKKLSVTGAVASVSAEELTKVPTSNVAQNLAGRLPGLIVSQTTGRPGADNPTIKIRGFGSNDKNGVQKESPLVIVDGVQRDFSQLDPSEIESITVLKDASAAVYGVQASAGVLLVTTKRGKEGKPAFSYSGSLSMTEATQMPQLANIKEWGDALKYSSYYVEPSNPALNGNMILADLVGRITPERLASLADGTNPGTNWQDVVTRDFAPVHQHNFNVRGGTETVKYFVSAGFLNQGTIWKSGDFNYERFNFSMNLDTRFSKNLTGAFDIGWRRQTDNQSNADGTGDMDLIEYAHPGYPSSIPGGRLGIVTHENAYSPIVATTADLGGYKKAIVDVLNASGTLNYNIPWVKGLSAKGMMGIYKTHQNTKALKRAYSLYAWDGTNFNNELKGNGGSNDLSERNDQFQRVTTQLSLSYARDFGKHSVSGLVLWETLNEMSTNYTAIGKGLLSPEVPYLFASNTDLRDAGGSASEFGRSGIVGRVNYNFSDKYLVELSMRSDASPYFPKNTRRGFFPGISLGWRLSEEAFMKKVNFFDNLKLRASVSQLGNDMANSFDYIEAFQILGVARGYLFDNKYQTGIATTGTPNFDITWQKVNMYNVGIDATLFNNSLTMELDFFYRYRYDLLAKDDQNTKLPSTVGDNVPYKNIESRDNRGIELTLGYKKHLGDVFFNVTGNVTWTREKYRDNIALQEYSDPDLARINKKTGQWVNRTFGYVFDGFFNNKEEIANADIDYSGGNGNASIKPGDIRLKDLNGDKKIDERDQVIIGRGDMPEITFGANLSVEWKGFDLTAFFQGASHFEKNMNGLQRAVDKGRVPYKYLVDNAWTPENTGRAMFPVDGQGVTNKGNIDIFRVDATYLRMKNLVLGYTLPKKLVSKIGVSNLRFSVSATNLFTLDNMGVYPFDPEGSDRTQYPIQRTFSGNINLTF